MPPSGKARPLRAALDTSRGIQLGIQNQDTDLHQRPTSCDTYSSSKECSHSNRTSKFKQNCAKRNTRGKESLTFFQLFLKLFNFFLELAEHSILGILINPSLVLYVLGSVCIPESADGLIVVVVCWSNVCTLQHVETKLLEDSVRAQHKALQEPTPSSDSFALLLFPNLSSCFYTGATLDYSSTGSVRSHACMYMCAVFRTSSIQRQREKKER